MRHSLLAIGCAALVVACDKDVPLPTEAQRTDLPRSNSSVVGFAERVGLVPNNIWHIERGSYADLEAERLAELHSRSGAGWSRIGIYGFNAQTEGYSIKTAQMLSAKGIKLFATLSWADNNPLPSDAEWQQFVTWAVAAHPQVSVFGLFNEPNDWYYFHGEGADYDRLAMIASPIIRAAGKLVAIADFSDPGDWGNDQTRHCKKLETPPCGVYGDFWMLQRLTNLVGYYDIVTVHGYPVPPYYGLQPLWDGFSYWANVANNFGGKPLWVTETGGYTYGDDWHQRYINNAILDQMNVTPNWQKTFIFQLYVGPGSVEIAHWQPGSGSTLAVINPRPSFYGIMNHTCSNGANCVKVARWHAQWNGAHFYSTNPTEVDGVSGWVEDGDNYFYLGMGVGTVPLYQCWSQPAHMLTLQSNCENKPGFVFDRFLGQISPDSLPGMTRLVRYYRASDTDYLSVNCPRDQDDALMAGYGSPVTLGWVHSDRCWSQPGYVSSIEGPSELGAWQNCQWHGSSTLPFGPLNYQWYADGSPIGSGQTLNYSAGYSFNLTLIVTNTQGQSRSADRYVDIYPGGPGCWW